MKAQVSSEFLFYIGIFTLIILIGSVSIFYIQDSDNKYYSSLLQKQEGQIIADYFNTVYKGGSGFSLTVYPSFNSIRNGVFYFDSSSGWLYIGPNTYYYPLPSLSYNSNCKKTIDGKEWNYINLNSSKLIFINKEDSIYVVGGCNE